MNVADRDIPLDESIAWLDRQVRSRVGPGMTARQREAKDIAESHVRLPSLEIVGYRSWLCEVCARELCKDAERWSWLACGRCRAVDAGVAHRLGGRRFLPLGRHSIMNGAGIPLSASEGPELTAMFERVVAMSDACDRLHARGSPPRRSDCSRSHRTRWGLPGGRSGSRPGSRVPQTPTGGC